MIDAEVQVVLDALGPSGTIAVEEMTPEAARALMVAMRESLPAGPELPHVVDDVFAGPAGPVPVRVYSAETGTPDPALVHFHGGGWVLGDLDSGDAFLRTLVVETGYTVISVDYRLAPEHPFPAAVDDCFAALEWVASSACELGVDESRIAVGGDSAGGNLAAAVALRARDRGGPRIAYQLLIYPVTDHDLDTPSYHANASGYLLGRSGMQWFWDHYVPDVGSRMDPEASPLRAASLAGLPPAYVITAEYDPLRDEGQAYAERLRAAGVPVTLDACPGVIHGFFTMTGLRASTAARQRLLDDMGARLR